jgi:hypothetical protein
MVTCRLFLSRLDLFSYIICLLFAVQSRKRGGYGELYRALCSLEWCRIALDLRVDPVPLSGGHCRWLEGVLKPQNVKPRVLVERTISVLNLLSGGILLRQIWGGIEETPCCWL